MTNLEVLKKSTLMGKELTVYGTMQEPLFLAKEVAEWIDYDSSSLNKMVSNVDDDEKVRNNIPTLGGNQDVWMLTENGIYEVLMQSRKPVAKEFKKGVKKILHEIRTSGGYLATNENDTPEIIMARALKVADETLKRREAEIENQRKKIEIQDSQLKEAAPKVQYVNGVLQSVNTYTTTQIAKEMGMAAVKLNRILKEKRILFKQSGQWMLTSKYQGNGYTKTKTYSYTRNDGEVGTNINTVWTEAGRMFLHKVVESEKTA